ncbi:hypothetical protein CMT19_01015 [Elizabethkingia anophelis]|uniref:hypothetical protein n=1 Tax=Elizabethkingia anophelis TaxID=1117645 RepID=UPI0020B2DE8F|nr:hypothetical protein [Elizabethkingia anophelis]MDV4099623.1 hypothetical protein [Elizabethkingia anophelis]UTF99027.1 hypothetical protein J2O04_12200 [Elizabethkingia anophelis]UTG63785.1 hypothetical protein J2O02_11910 [Elizabethkingia anophelis]
MVGSNFFKVLFFTISVISCSKNQIHENVSIKIINKEILYNKDIITYYIVNKSEKDLKILCNPDLFRRSNDSLVVNTWFSPRIKIFNEGKIVNPNVYHIDWNKNILDSLQNVKEKYIQLEDHNVLLEKDITAMIKKYSIIIKKNDSVKFITKINFETEPHFYKSWETEGYILDGTKKYQMNICLNDNFKSTINEKLKNAGVYTNKICSERIRLNVHNTTH